MEEKADAEMLSNELKIKAGFGKDGEKGFEDVYKRQIYRPVLDIVKL